MPKYTLFFMIIMLCSGCFFSDSDSELCLGAQFSPSSSIYLAKGATLSTTLGGTYISPISGDVNCDADNTSEIKRVEVIAGKSFITVTNNTKTLTFQGREPGDATLRILDANDREVVLDVQVRDIERTALSWNNGTYESADDTDVVLLANAQVPISIHSRDVDDNYLFGVHPWRDTPWDVTCEYNWGWSRDCMFNTHSEPQTVMVDTPNGKSQYQVEIVAPETVDKVQLCFEDRCIDHNQSGKIYGFGNRNAIVKYLLADGREVFGDDLDFKIKSDVIDLLAVNTKRQFVADVPPSVSTTIKINAVNRTWIYNVSSSH